MADPCGHHWLIGTLASQPRPHVDNVRRPPGEGSPAPKRQGGPSLFEVMNRRRRLRGERKGPNRESAGRSIWRGGGRLHLIERIVGPLGLRVDESSPWADARLPEGSRVQTKLLAPDSDAAVSRLGHRTGEPQLRRRTGRRAPPIGACLCARLPADCGTSGSETKF